MFTLEIICEEPALIFRPAEINRFLRTEFLSTHEKSSKLHSQLFVVRAKFYFSERITKKGGSEQEKNNQLQCVFRLNLAAKFGWYRVFASWNFAFTFRIYRCNLGAVFVLFYHFEKFTTHSFASYIFTVYFLKLFRGRFSLCSIELLFAGLFVFKRSPKRKAAQEKKRERKRERTRERERMREINSERFICLVKSWENRVKEQRNTFAHTKKFRVIANRSETKQKKINVTFVRIPFILYY